MRFFSRKSSVKDDGAKGKKEGRTVLRSRKNRGDRSSKIEIQTVDAVTSDAQHRLPVPHDMVNRKPSSIYSTPPPDPTVPVRHSYFPTMDLDFGAIRSLSLNVYDPAIYPADDGDDDDFAQPQAQASPFDSPTFEASKRGDVSKDTGYYNPNNSDSGYESAETSFPSFAPHGNYSLESYSRPPPEIDAISVKSTQSKGPGMLHRKRGQILSSHEPVPPLPSTATSALHDFAPLPGTAVTQHDQVVSSPPISILEGFKVNTRGRILDEEGDVIGELIEGDLLDCVRQRANARGEVLDDYGRVVGRVKTVSRAIGTPTTLTTSSESGHAPSAPSGAGPVYPKPPSRHQKEPLLPPPLVITKPPPTPPEEAPLPPVPPITAPEKRATRQGSEASVGALPIVDAATSSFSTETLRAVEDHHVRESVPPRPSASNEKEQKQEEVTSQGPGPSVTFAGPEYSTIAAGETAATDRSRSRHRSSTDRIVPNYSRSQSRISISSVLANKQNDDSRSGYTPSVFSYRGDIPAADGPPGHTRSRSKAPSVYSAVGQGSQPLNVKIAHVTSAAGQHRVHVTGDPTGPRPSRPNLAGRSSMYSTYKPSPLSSHETTPNDSPEGTERSISDDGRSHRLYQSSASSMYAGRIAHTQSANTSRTYFTHAGRVTVQAGEQAAAQKSAPTNADAQPVEPAAPLKPVEKKKRRFSLSSRKNRT